MQREPDLVLPASIMTEQQPVSAPKAVGGCRLQDFNGAFHIGMAVVHFVTRVSEWGTGSTLSELASWLCAGGSGSLETSQTEYTPHLVDSLMSIHFHRRIFYFMPATMKPSTDSEVRHIQGQIHGESGLRPEDVAPGEKLCVLRGCLVPAVLRQKQDQYMILGEAYVPLAMHGEAVLAAEEEEYEDFWIRQLKKKLAGCLYGPFHNFKVVVSRERSLLNLWSRSNHLSQTRRTNVRYPR